VSYVSPQSDADEAWLRDALITFARSREPKLGDEIAERTLWLATRGARRFADRGEPFDDLVQVARIGLLKAIDRYDPALGIQFGGYATPTIIGELRRHFRDHTWSVHVSRRAKDLRQSVNEATDTLSKTLHRSPTIAEIAATLHVAPDAVVEALEANNAYRTYSLDSNGGASSPLDEGGFTDVLDRETISGLLSHLRPRERQILYLRYFDELSQAEIAERIGTSQVHIGRLIAASLIELRSHLLPDT
jgi:RNA polymerase sigma-B factor